MNGAAALGGLIFNLVEPYPGHDCAFRHWYGTDHYYAGAMAGPGVVAGRCWQGTSAWTPGGVSDVSRMFLGTYFLLAGALPAYQQWSADTHPGLAAAGRMFAQRRQVHRGRYGYTGGPDGTEAIGALDRDFPALLAILVPPSAPAQPADDAAWAGDWPDLAFDPVPGGYSEIATPQHRLLLCFRRVPADTLSAGQLHTAVAAGVTVGGQAATWVGLFRPVPVASLISPEAG